MVSLDDSNPKLAVEVDNEEIKKITEELQVQKEGEGDKAVDVEEKTLTKKKKNKKKKKGNKSAICSLKTVYTDEVYPLGEIILSTKMHSEQIEDKNDDYSHRLNCLRKAAEAHRRARMHMVNKLKPGCELSEFCHELEDKVYTLIDECGIKANMAFPTGVSLNECAAHYTTEFDEKRIVQEGDIIKVDFGVHVEGNLIDSAFTVNLNPRIENLRQATIDATNTALKLTGPDASIFDITSAIEETITSYEVVDENGNVLPVKIVENLYGHQIDRYQIHAGKNIPLIRGAQTGLGRMQVGEQYAIETFASINGNGRVSDRGSVTHFMAAEGWQNYKHPTNTINNVLKVIRQNHHTLAFCQRFLHRKLKDMTPTKLNWILGQLVKQGVLKDYPPLSDKVGSMTSQMEHSFFIRENGSEILSRGIDY